MRATIRHVCTALAVVTLFTIAAPQARADERLCDASFEDCRKPLLQLIRQETVGLDVSFWFMQDARYSAEIIRRWQAGVPVRILVDVRASPLNPGNQDIIDSLAKAGIPIRNRTASGILHWKQMLFAGQNVVEFSGANYSPTAFVPQAPYSDYEDEVIYFTDDPITVNSFRTKFDDLWLDDANYANYANVTSPRSRVYPVFPKDPELNFPQTESYFNRIARRYAAEAKQIDVIMFRITDERHTDAMIAAQRRGVPVRIISDMAEYRKPSRQYVSYNMDKLWAAGIPLHVRAHSGLNHQKLVLLYGQQLTVFGSSNWSSPSDNQQQEHNYFTAKPWIFDFFSSQFDRKWNNRAPNGAVETSEFVPQPPDRPISVSPANGAPIQAGATVTLKWNGGYWAHYYDVYFGTEPNPPLYAANLSLGPYDYSKKAAQQVKLPPLQPGATYYWRIVSRTAAGLTASGPTSSFTVAGMPPPPPPPPADATTVVLRAKDVAPENVFGRWQFITDATAAGGTALFNPDKGNARIAPALAVPANYFEVTFNAIAGVPYHVWTRLRAYNNSLNNDSVSLQFSDASDMFGTPMYRIGTPSAAEIVLQDGAADTSLSGWGWADNGFGTFGADVYFTTSGLHTLRVQQRTDGAVVDQVVLSPDTFVRMAPGATDNDATWVGSASVASTTLEPAVAATWSQGTVGVVGINGLATIDAAQSAMSIVAGGGNLWGTKDGGHFVYQPLTGDASIVARVTGITNTGGSARVGVMIRESLAANAAYASMTLSAGRTAGFQRRLATAADTRGTEGIAAAAPQWVRLDRAGDTFTAYQSIDGVTWQYVGTDTVRMSAPTVFVGVFATSANTLKTTAAGVDRVAIAAGTPAGPAAPTAAALPDGWTHADVGQVGYTGRVDLADSTWTVAGAGADVAGAADAFHFAYRSLTGDGALVARVRAIQNISSSSRAGVMMRQSLDPAAANVFMAVTRAKGAVMSRRRARGETTTVTGTGTAAAPYWVRIERAGDTFSAYQSADGAEWTLVGTESIVMPETIAIGLAVTSRSTIATAAALFDQVTVSEAMPAVDAPSDPAGDGQSVEPDPVVPGPDPGTSTDGQD